MSTKDHGHPLNNNKKCMVDSVIHGLAMGQQKQEAKEANKIDGWSTYGES